ncbi:VOC family protein [Streptomyces sp. NPDC005336]|uniref:VOC family protein n=1 Tax=Streptomyces sp. NPDC005336 TaxID=3157035 RepID=UPI0033BC85ED
MSKRPISKVDHVGIAVPDMGEAARLFHDALGGQFLDGGDNDGTGIRLEHFAFPGFKVEVPTADLDVADEPCVGDVGGRAHQQAAGLRH